MVHNPADFQNRDAYMFAYGAGCLACNTAYDDEISMRNPVQLSSCTHKVCMACFDITVRCPVSTCGWYISRTRKIVDHHELTWIKELKNRWIEAEAQKKWNESQQRLPQNREPQPPNPAT